MLLALSGATIMHTPMPADIAAAGAAGFRAFEIAASKLDTYLQEHTIEELHAAFEAQGIQPIAIGAVMGVTFRPPNEYVDVQARLCQLAKAAAALGCRDVVVTPGPAPADTSWAEVRAETVRVLQDLGSIAGRHDVRVGFEFLGYPGSSVRTLAQGWEVVKQAGRGNVGLVLDVSQFYIGGSDLKGMLDVPQEGIDLVHLCDVEDRPRETLKAAHRLLPGEGVLPLDDILIRLRHIGYDKPCTVELFRPAYWERDPVELARAAREAALEYVGEYFSVE
ncbi:MAG: sugar phosphate isomerase/epimerase [Chloroflexi bacterium]|nr:sugar phosphate isomerase/epimerase [Chloroflexota bacterium]MBU1746466.1 sugar phosphate isomerase/epimerase [Chloroflexota bacterium]MBU1879467.1 sugar phosphate isomerase/epimerase [Chloroflexota bacterium]